jgi:hypothetical protein
LAIIVGGLALVLYSPHNLLLAVAGWMLVGVGLLWGLVVIVSTKNALDLLVNGVLAFAAVAIGISIYGAASGTKHLIVRLVETDKKIFVPASGTKLTGPSGVGVLIPFGYCESHSRTDPNRGDAFVCATPDNKPGHRWGPCFLTPDSYAQVECFATPWDKATLSGAPWSQLADASFAKVVFRLRGALKGNPQGWDKPWALQLPRSRYCLNYTGKTVRPSGPLDAYYECRGPLAHTASGPWKQITWNKSPIVGWVMYSFPDESQKIWTVQFVSAGRVGEGTAPTRVLAAWK